MLQQLIIQGGSPLQGTVNISGAKNAALPLMTAALLTSGEHELENVPLLADVSTMGKLLTHLGCDVQRREQSLFINADKVKSDDAPYDLVRTMRASVLVMGPLVARLGHARISLPGGCAIGARPINLHLKALEKMGAKVELENGYVNVRAKKLYGANIIFDTVTVTGTENIMMAATLADGMTVLENAAREPEVAELAEYLNEMGARISGAGSDRISIEGVSQLRPAHHRVRPDRIEAGTFAIAAAITGGEITLNDCPNFALEILTARLRDAGVICETGENTLTIRAPQKLNPVHITTAPFPGFATDLQAQFMALMCLADGTSIITETIFENRFMHAPELMRMGARIDIEGAAAVIKGVSQLTGAPVMATDLRASASLVLAALAARGVSHVRRIYHLDRGYERMDEKLIALGARIRREAE